MIEMNRKTLQTPEREKEKEKEKSAHTHTCVSQVLLLHSPASSSPRFCRLRASQSPAAAAAFTKSAPRFRDPGPISVIPNPVENGEYDLCEREKKFCNQ